MLDIDPIVLASNPAPEQVVYKCKEYLLHLGVHNAEMPSVTWSLGEEYGRNKNKFWRCGICKKTTMLAIRNGMSSAIRHLRKDHKIDKKGKRILTKQKTITETATAVARTVTQVVTRSTNIRLPELSFSQLPHFARGLGLPGLFLGRAVFKRKPGQALF